MKVRTFSTAALSAAMVVAAVAVSASVPVGIYAVVEKAILEPGDAEPQRVQIWGTFAVWDEQLGRWQEPERGYLYYTCSKEQIRICRNEWADLKSVAGTGQMVGFGSRSLAAGRVKPADERASAPRTYPVQFGVVRMGTSPRGSVFDQLRALARGR